MKKIHYFKFIALASVFMFALVFMVFNFTQGQVKNTKKPIKPPPVEYVWSTVLLAGENVGVQGVGETNYFGIGGDGWLYDSAEPNIDIRVGVSYEIQSQYRSGFNIKIYFPAQGENSHQIDFTENIDSMYAYFESDPPGYTYKSCRYPICSVPELINCSSPYCMFDFLQNSFHPCQGYDVVEFVFRGKWSDDPIEYDFENWTLNEVELPLLNRTLFDLVP